MWVLVHTWVTFRSEYRGASRPDTYPRLASDVAYIEPEKVLDVCKIILEIQRDFGDRTDRKQGRLKYTVDRMGLDNFKKMMEERLGYALEDAKPVVFKTSADNGYLRHN